jgi:hypothetical protein
VHRVCVGVAGKPRAHHEGTLYRNQPGSCPKQVGQ